MALHKDLPIYKAAFDLLKLAAELTRHMPRDFKASVGGRVRDECVECMVLIAKANACKDDRRQHYLAGLLEHLHVAELLLRLAHDMRFISPAQWSRSVQATNLVGRQATGWRRSVAAPSVA